MNNILDDDQFYEVEQDRFSKQSSRYMLYLGRSLLALAILFIIANLSKAFELLAIPMLVVLLSIFSFSFLGFVSGIRSYFNKESITTKRTWTLMGHLLTLSILLVIFYFTVTDILHLIGEI